MAAYILITRRVAQITLKGFTGENVRGGTEAMRTKRGFYRAELDSPVNLPSTDAYSD